MKLTTQAK